MSHGDSSSDEARKRGADLRSKTPGPGFGSTVAFRRSSLIHRPAVAQPRGWYTTGTDFCYYAIAQRACRESRERLAKLKLSPAERQLMAAVPWDAGAIIGKLKVIMEEQEKQMKRPAPRAIKRSGEFFSRFCEVVSRAAGLVQALLGQGTEYTLPFALLMILFKAVVTRKDREEALLVHLQVLVTKLPPDSLYETKTPTNALKLGVANVYAEFIRLLDDALGYFRSGRYGKLVDAILQPPDHKIAACIERIDQEAKKLEDSKIIAQQGQGVELKDAVTQTAKLVAKLIDGVEKATVALSMSMEILSDRVTALETRLNQMGDFEKIKYAQSLQTSLLSSQMDMYWDAEGALARLAAGEFRLALKDHWENNGILENLTDWSRGQNNGPLLWIGGQSGNQNTWVSELSVDLVHALSPQPLTLLYLFCSDMAATSVLPTPTRLVKSLISQILGIHPHLAYENPSAYSLQRFQHAITFDQVWSIFESLLFSVPDVFIVIDRAEECVADEVADLSNFLLPSLMRLLPRVPGARAIITSIYEPPDEVLDLEEQDVLESIYIDTSRLIKTR